MASSIDICSKALVALGDVPISSFTEETDAARVCATVYPIIRDEIISLHDWRVMTHKTQLTRDSVDPITEWNYSYVIPSISLSGGIVALFDTNAKGAKPTADFEIFGRRVYTDHEQVWADLVVQKPEAEWPAWFVGLMWRAVAAEIALTVTDSQSAADRWAAETYGSPAQEGRGGFFARAMLADAQGQGNYSLENDAFVDARAGGWF